MSRLGLFVGSLALVIVSCEDCNCLDCKIVPFGEFTGNWSLVKFPMNSCERNGCLYVNQDGTQKCFCDPGPVAYYKCEDAGCPVGYKLKSTKPTPATTSTPITGDLEFQIVPAGSNGPIATREEVEANLEKITKLLQLHEYDLVQIEGGSFNLTGTNVTISDQNCTECAKVIVSEVAPPEEYNVNVADVCCFIIRRSNNTYVLTNHPLLTSFPHENCSSGCLYTLYEDLKYERDENSTSYCLNETETYSCCSEETGKFCQHYGEEAKKNRGENGTCSNVCMEIANCSSDISNSWCQVEHLVPENNISPCVPDKVPENCTAVVSQPVLQTAVFYPSALPEVPFTEPRGKRTTRSLNLVFGKRVKRRSGKRSGCPYWYFWRYTCTDAYNYATYNIGTNWYRVRPYRKCWFKHACCSTFQPQCNYGGRKYSCPRG